MMLLSADELRRLAAGFRSGAMSRTDGALVELIESDVAGYRAIVAAGPGQPPSAPLDALLPLMGWLICEASWEAVQRITAGFGRLGPRDGRRVQSESARDCVHRLADVARGLPWPEFAPRALSAVRAQALAEARLDTPVGYDAAWLLHEEAKIRYLEYRDSHGDKPGREEYVQVLDEELVQVGLAETGIACHTAERVIGRWAEEFADADPEVSRVREEQWIHRMVGQLTDGLEVGRLALEQAERTRLTERADRAEWTGKVGRADTGARAGRVKQGVEHQPAPRAARQNPGITTARAAMLLLSLWPQMARLGQLPPAGFGTWVQWEADLLRRFETACRAIERGSGPGRAPTAIRAGLHPQFVRAQPELASPAARRALRGGRPETEAAAEPSWDGARTGSDAPAHSLIA
ncbi:MAG TPA: hypothetical protein VGX23_22455 [Actinocrinis sp.]|nr:hypothetical protein [Actinocrinis sp.]